MNELTRRDALRWLAGASVAVAVPSAALGGSVGGTIEPLCARLNRCFANSLDARRAIGSRYLALEPQEADPKVLAALVCGNAENYAKLVSADHRHIREFLLARQKSDFELGRTVRVSGWILSQTEARLCAIAAVV